jgi:aminopeptidase
MEVARMLSKDKMGKYADVLLWALKTARTGRYKQGDIILVRYDLPAVSLAETMQEKMLTMGMNPILRLSGTPTMERSFFEKAKRHQLLFVPPGEKTLYENLNGGIYLNAPDSLTHLSEVDPNKIGKRAIVLKPFRDILDKREAKGLFGWTLCLLPTQALARQARMSIRAYASQVSRACYLDQEDPVKEWRKIYRKATVIKQWLNKKKVAHLHIESENTDLRIRPGQRRRWIGISGHNIPSFEIFLSPDWRGTEGVYYANLPSFRSGNYVAGARFVFRKGVAVKIDAEKGEPFLVKQLTIDKGARRVGEFSLTDNRFSRINRFMANTLFDENHGGRYGNCHLALGASYGDTYDGDPAKLNRERKQKLGFNDSALHWDLVNTEKKLVTATLTSGKKEIIYEKGRFAY